MNEIKNRLEWCIKQYHNSNEWRTEESPVKGLTMFDWICEANNDNDIDLWASSLYERIKRQLAFEYHDEIRQEEEMENMTVERFLQILEYLKD